MALVDREEQQAHACTLAKVLDLDRAIKIMHTCQADKFTHAQKVQLANIFVQHNVHATALIYMKDELCEGYLNKLLLD